MTRSNCRYYDSELDILDDSDHVSSNDSGSDYGAPEPVKKKRTPKKPQPLKSKPTPAKNQKPKAKKVTEKVAPKNKATEKKKKVEPTKTKKTVTKKPPIFDYDEVTKLASLNPDSYWKYYPGSENGNEDIESRMVDTVNQACPLELETDAKIRDQGPITGMALSSDGTMLATFSSVGYAKIWDVDTWDCIRKLKDMEEEQIEEFWTGCFNAEDAVLFAGGKRKDRKRWIDNEEDNQILPCHIKVFDVVTGEVALRLEGHEEEVLCIKSVQFKGNNYMITTSQDGYIIKWKMDQEWRKLEEMFKLNDGVTCMAFSVSFVPNTGNKYFIGACDEHIRLYDFETNQLLKTFENIYSSYCDCAKFIKAVDLEEEDEELNKENKSSKKFPVLSYYLMSRGVELLDMEDNTVASRQNSCALHKLTINPNNATDPFKLEDVKKYYHENYHSNSWYVKFSSNGRYISAPTFMGQVYFFNILSGQVSAILKDHDNCEVRDTLFHPTRPLFFSAGDDGVVHVYRSFIKTYPDPEVELNITAVEETVNSSEESVEESQPER